MFESNALVDQVDQVRARIIAEWSASLEQRFKIQEWSKVNGKDI